MPVGQIVSQILPVLLFDFIRQLNDSHFRRMLSDLPRLLYRTVLPRLIGIGRSKAS